MTDSDPLPISLVAHTVFCSRRAWLESVGETVPSIAIEQGIADHDRVDAGRGERMSTRRSVAIEHPDLGLTGKCDVVDARGGAVQIVEFKSAPIRRSYVVTTAQRIQLALQRLCLESSGVAVDTQAVHFTTSRRTVEVPLSQGDFDEAIRYVELTRQIVNARSAPEPLMDDPRCTRCSHASICLPDERRSHAVRRRVVAPDPGAEVVHVTTPGARVSLSKGRLIVSNSEGELASLPIERPQALVLHGNVDVSSAVIREFLWTDRPVVWASARGQVMGFARSARSANGLARVRQHERSSQGDLGLAREFISSKIANQATQLRRNGRDPQPEVIKRLRDLARRSLAAPTVSALFGIEGDAAAIYFRWLPTMVGSPTFIEEWSGRIGRGARDPLNTALNVAYGLLLGDQLRAIAATGLDPHAGFVHSSSRNKPALALDLMEQFRPVVADSAVLSAINNGELTRAMFSPAFGDARLRDSGRKAIVSAYERRVQTEFRHPVFKYTVTWRRAMEIQARMVLGVLDGTQERYLGIRVR